MAKGNDESGNTKQSKPDSAAFSYFRVHEQHKTVRTIAICTTVIICLGIGMLGDDQDRGGRALAVVAYTRVGYFGWNPIWRILRIDPCLPPVYQTSQ